MPGPLDPIGLFDSGIGGLSVLRALRTLLPLEDCVYHADTGHAPYGERDDAFVMERAQAQARELIEQRRAKLLVVACNTATAAAIHDLRATWPQVPIVGVEPALKPAAAGSRTGRVGVLATRGTLASEKFRQLQASLAGQAEFILQPCDGLAAAIESGQADETRSLCARYLAALGGLGASPGQIDTVVLGCTHYAFAMEDILRIVGPEVRVLDTGEPVARQVRRLLEQARLLAPAPAAAPAGTSPACGRLTLLTTGSIALLEAAARRWLPA
jgi:glutamate racemase